MTCTGYPPAELTEVFKTLRVDEDANTSQALDMLKKEKIRLETEIQNLKKSIAENQQIVQNMIKQLELLKHGIKIQTLLQKRNM